MSTARVAVRAARWQVIREANLLRNAAVRSTTRISKQTQREYSTPSRESRPWGTAQRRSSRALESQSGEASHAASEQIPESSQAQDQQQSPGPNSQLAATLASSDSSDLIAEVHIPDDPHSVLPPDHPALSILGNSSLVIQRQIEMMNIILGFEQANRYVIMDGQGQTLGYIAERDHGIGSAMARNLFHTHRSFTTHIFDTQEREVLRIHRPFAVINSRVRIYDPVPEGGYPPREASPSTEVATQFSGGTYTGMATTAQISPLKLEEMRIIGESQQQWAPLRRKYNLFHHRPLTDTPAIEASTPDASIEKGMTQFAHISEPMLSWDFTLRGESGDVQGSVNRNFGGFAREIFTDTGVYALRMDSAAQAATLEDKDGNAIAHYERDARGMALDTRAVMLATAVSIDFDYFSRHSGGTGFMPLPLFFPGVGGGGAVAAGEAGAVGAGAAGGVLAGEAGAGILGGAAGAAGRAGIGGAAGVGEGAIAGAGAMAGVEAMRGVGGGSSQTPTASSGQDTGGFVDDASPTNGNLFNDGYGGGGSGVEQPGEQQDLWGEGQDPWSDKGATGGDASGGEGGGSWLDTLTDFFGGD